jgi:hypothetical protein
MYGAAARSLGMKMLKATAFLIAGNANRDHSFGAEHHLLLCFICFISDATHP